MNVIDLLEREQEKHEVPVLRSGDTVRVHVKVVEGTRERLQVFEGVVIAVSGTGGPRSSFTVRRVTHNVGVERRFLLHSPRIDRIEVVRHGEVRRARLYYLREKKGRAARIRERREPVGGSARTRTRAATAVEPVEEAPGTAADDEVDAVDDEEVSAEATAAAEADASPDADAASEAGADPGGKPAGKASADAGASTVT